MLVEELGAGNIFLGFFTFFGELNLIFLLNLLVVESLKKLIKRLSQILMAYL
jgi:hypothetical protein